MSESDTLSRWRQDEIRRIAASDDLKIAPFREDGKTYGTPTWIWSVVVDDELYVRPYNGAQSRWYQAARRQKTGRILAAGLTKEIAFAPVTGDALNDRIDAAYRAKYGNSPYVAPMLAAPIRACTIRVAPR